MSSEAVSLPIENLATIKVDPKWSGAEKRAIKMQSGTDILAAKIHSGKWTKSKETKSKREFSAYQLLSKTPLGMYIPNPYFLLQNNENHTVGLAVEWRDGKSLSDIYPAKPLTNEDVDSLQEALLSSAVGNSVPMDDMFSEQNLMFCSEPEKPKLWIAECSLVRLGYEEYKFRVKRDMDYLRQQYIPR